MAKTGNKQADLGDWRGKIDRLDEKIVSLLGERAKCVTEIGKIKSANGTAVYDPKRETEIIERLKALSPNLPEKALASIYREIFSAARALEKPLSIAYLGPAGTFSNEAALEIFGSSASYVPCPGWQAVFDEVENSRADLGVLPIENSIEGSVNLSLDLLKDSPLKIYGEKTIEARQNLASKLDSTGNVKRLYSHIQPLGQCRRFIASNLARAQVVETYSTADAAEKASADPESAAICSLAAAKKYGLSVLKERIEDSPSFTRFIVLSHNEARRSGSDKTSIAVNIKNRPKELYRLLGVFAKRGINLTKIASRPLAGSNWEHLFFIDLDGHKEDKKVAGALKTAAGMGRSLKILGSYPKEK